MTSLINLYPAYTFAASGSNYHAHMQGESNRSQKSPYLEIWAPELLVYKHLETGEKLCFKSRDKIHERQKSTLLLAIIATPMDSAYSMHNAYRHVLYAHAHN